MKVRLLALALMTLMGSLVSGPAVRAQEGYPAKVVTMVVPAAPGGTTDISARMVADPLSKSFGQQVIVDNKPGANGSIATSFVARAKPDGHILLMQYSGYHVITPHLIKQDWDPIKNFAPVANVLSAPQVIVARARSASEGAARAGVICQSQSGQADLCLLRERIVAARDGRHVRYC
jgi:tripartite-type tricarboxylate transporter receptor subunit TctC